MREARGRERFEFERIAPRISLGRFPTPVEPLTVPGLDGTIWVKRDDLSGDLYGGNKVRKLEFLLGVARSRGAGRLVTAGAFGSHHALATTVYGRRLGFEVTLVLCPQRVTDHVRKVLEADVGLGAAIRVVPRMELIPPGLWWERLRAVGDRPYVVPPGGSNVAGTLGYVRAALELLEQVKRGELPPPDVIHVACGTMGTAAGLAIGLALGDAPTRVSAVRVVGSLVTHERGLRRLVGATLKALSRSGARAPALHAVLSRIRLRHDQLGGGYGKPTPAGEEAMERFREAGLELDPTYTAKAAAGLLASLGEEPGLRSLYWHTLSRTVPETGPVEPARAAVPDEILRIVSGSEGG